MTPTDVVFAAGFCIGVLILIVIAANSHVSDWPGNEILVTWLARSAGLAMSSVALLCLLSRTVQGGNIAEAAPLTLPLLSGVVLAHGSWAVAVALGVIVTAGLACHHFGGRSGAAERPEDG